MVDYTRSTGNSGTMMIRDTGTAVEFWINANESSTWANEMPWGYTVNGSTSGWLEHRYSQGAGWDKLGSWNVTTDQTVTFRLGDTGTNALGGPTTFSQFIERAGIPSAPSKPAISSVTASSVYATFTDGANGGAAIDSRQIGYGANSSTPSTIIASDRSTTITGLSGGTTYYFWARTHNSKGWSAWSARASAKTLQYPSPPSVPLLSRVAATSVDVSFSANSNGGSPITQFQIGYGTNSSTPTTTVTASSPRLITGLTPGTVYYFRTRAKNAVGWSAWSGASSARTVAGAYVKVGVTWKLAVPYVKVGGVWKMAEPWVRTMGVWKTTT